MADTMEDTMADPIADTVEDTIADTIADPIAESENGVEVAAEDAVEVAAPAEIEKIRDEILDTEEMRKIFVGGIALESKDEELKEFFEKMCGGEVTDNVIIRKEGKKSHIGFLTLASSECVDEILFKRAELKFNGRDLDVNRAVPKNSGSTGAHEKTKKLFIANVPKTGCTDDDLKNYFEARHDSKYGTIESVLLIKKKDEEGNKLEENKGFGFIMVSSEDMADKMAIQHSTFEFGGRTIELKKSVPTNEGGGRGRGRGRGSARGGRGGGGQYGAPYGGYGDYYGGGYGGQWDAYGASYGGYYGGGYAPYAGGYGGGGGAPTGRGRGASRGGQRSAPY